jgi:preprotein translocase subunit SecE
VATASGRNPLRGAMDEGTGRSRRRLQFVAEVISELTKVTWPSRQEVIRLTMLVLVVALSVGVFIGLWDFGLGQIVNRYLL